MRKRERSEQQKKQREGGFSMIELLIVLLLVALMSTLTLFYATSHKKLYEPDDQALQIGDMMQEARQRALTQRRTMRVEINLSTNAAYLYDENRNSTSSADDVLLKTLRLFAATRVRVDTRPFEIAYNPPERMPVPNAVFKPSVYTPSVSQNVCTVRFLPNGSAVDAGNNAVGTGATATGLTLHVWSPRQSNPNQSDIARAITVLGATGFVRLWEYRRDSPDINKWKDSRRRSSY